MAQNNKLKVLQINTVCGRGSTGGIAVNINENLIKNGHTGIVAYGVGSCGYKHSHKIGGKANYYFHNIMSRIFGHEGFYSRVATRRFIRWIKNYKPDIIHLHNIHGHYVNVKLLFKYLKSSAAPLVWTLHDCWPFTGKCTYFDIANCTKWQTRCYNCPQLKEYPASIFDSSKMDYISKRALFSDIDINFAPPSDWLKGLLEQSYLKSNPAEVINNGIDISIFRKSEMQNSNLAGRLKDKFVVLGVAFPWSARKGYADFIEIAEKLKNNDKIVIVMVGLNDAQAAAAPANVIALARTDSRKELAELYTRADVFVNTTYEDNYPTVNLEALACGTYVITYDTGGSPEAVLMHKAGCVVDTGDYNKIGELIEEFSFKGVPSIKFDFKLLSSIISDDKYLALYKRLNASIM